MNGNRLFLVLACLIAICAPFLPGSAEASDSCFVHLAAEEETGEVHAFYRESDEVLIGADSGLFRLESDDLRRLASAEEIGIVLTFYPQGDALLVGATGGLFRLNGNDLARLTPEESTGAVWHFHPHADALLVGAEEGLFLLQGGNLRRIAPKEETGPIFFGFQAAGDVLLVVGMQGLFQFKDGNLRRFGAEELSNSTAFPKLFLYDDLLLVGASEGLFRLEGDDLRRLAPAEETGTVFDFYSQGDALLVGASEGLFRLEGDDLRRLAPAEETGTVFEFHPQADAVLVGTQEGVFRLAGDDLRRSTPPGVIRSVYAFYTYADAVVVSTGDGLYLLEGGDVRLLRSWEGSGILADLHPHGDALLVGHAQGLFRLQPAPPLSWALAQPERPVVDAYAGEIPFRFSVQHPCVSIWSADRVALVAVDTAKPAGATSNVNIIRSDLSHATIRGQIVLDQRGTYRLQLALTGDHGELMPFGEPIEFRVGWTLTDEVGHVVNAAWPFLLFVHTLLFVGLIIGARWSDRCWLLVTDPVWGRLGLWFHIVLRHFGPLQRWAMTRWFDRVRRSLTPIPYLPMPLAAEPGEMVASSDLLERLAGSRRLWLQGNAGMGKTSLMRELAYRFFADPELPSLFTAYRRFGFVPIFVALREFLAIRPDGAHPERWVPELARAAVAAGGVAFGDAALFRALLTSGGFAVILDGANEVEHGNEIEFFAKGTPGVRVLVTSQALPADAGQTFKTLRLPAAVGDAMLPLLRLFLGAARGDQVYRRVKSSPLLGALRSGYDVRLLADLAREDAGLDRLPNNRLGLYEAILDAVRLPDGSPYPVDRLSQAAWRMWCDGERKLKEAYLSADLLDPLRGESNRVVRTLDGATFEFRHDQMRAYRSGQR